MSKHELKDLWVVPTWVVISLCRARPVRRREWRLQTSLPHSPLILISDRSLHADTLAGWLWFRNLENNSHPARHALPRHHRRASKDPGIYLATAPAIYDKQPSLSPHCWLKKRLTRCELQWWRTGKRVFWYSASSSVLEVFLRFPFMTWLLLLLRAWWNQVGSKRWRHKA